MDLRFCILISLFSLASVVSAQNGLVVQPELWCVAKNNAEDAALQTSLDWACGPGGADCSLIQQGGPCYDPNDIQSTASYAFNDYYLKHGLADDACYFDNSAAVISLNPSHGDCKFPSSKKMKTGSISGSTTALGGGQGSTSADFSGGYRNFNTLFWFMIIGYFPIMIQFFRLN